MATNQGFKSFVPHPDKVDPSFLFHWLRANRAFLEGLGNGATFKEVSKAVVSRIEIALPPIPEQRRVADILDKADAIRRRRKEAISLTEEFLRSAFLEMFGDPVTNPMGWPVRSLGDVADAASGVTKGKRYDGQSMVTLPYMRVANVHDGRLVLDDVKSITVSEDDGRRYQLEKGDVLLTEGGDPDKLGRGTVWSGEIAKCIHQNHIFRVRPGPVLRSEYLSALIGSSRGKQYFLRAAKQTTGIASINMTQLKAFPVLLPPKELQDRYAVLAGRVAATRARLQHRGELTEALFGSLVARLFSSSPEAPC
jgi:type I restriction enzyme S subunit